MARSLFELITYLDGLGDRAPLDVLTAELEELELDLDDVAEHVQFSSRSYMRNLVHAGQWHHLLVLCWRNGQRSPIHDHAGSSCGVRVLQGTMTETRFACTKNGHVKAMGSVDYELGTVIGSQDADLHQVSNLQDDGADLVTLHVYSPPLLKMGTYSITDTSRGEELMLLEFCDAAGI